MFGRHIYESVRCDVRDRLVIKISRYTQGLVPRDSKSWNGGMTEWQNHGTSEHITPDPKRRNSRTTEILPITANPKNGTAKSHTKS